MLAGFLEVIFTILMSLKVQTLLNITLDKNTRGIDSLVHSMKLYMSPLHFLQP